MKTLTTLMGATMIAAMLFASGCSKQSATKYTCPMHPEVVQDGPGKCPKCGMDLQPKK